MDIDDDALKPENLVYCYRTIIIQGIGENGEDVEHRVIDKIQVKLKDGTLVDLDRYEDWLRRN